jgi:hypothetical protein
MELSGSSEKLVEENHSVTMLLQWCELKLKVKHGYVHDLYSLGFREASILICVPDATSRWSVTFQIYMLDIKRKYVVAKDSCLYASCGCSSTESHCCAHDLEFSAAVRVNSKQRLASIGQTYRGAGEWYMTFIDWDTLVLAGSPVFARAWADKTIDVHASTRNAMQPPCAVPAAFSIAEQSQQG